MKNALNTWPRLWGNRDSFSKEHGDEIPNNSRIYCHKGGVNSEEGHHSDDDLDPCERDATELKMESLWNKALTDLSNSLQPPLQLSTTPHGNVKNASSCTQSPSSALESVQATLFVKVLEARNITSHMACYRPRPSPGPWLDPPSVPEYISTTEKCSERDISLFSGADHQQQFYNSTRSWNDSRQDHMMPFLNVDTPPQPFVVLRLVRLDGRSFQEPGQVQTFAAHTTSGSLTWNEILEFPPFVVKNDREKNCSIVLPVDTSSDGNGQASTLFLNVSIQYSNAIPGSNPICVGSAEIDVMRLFFGDRNSRRRVNLRRKEWQHNNHEQNVNNSDRRSTPRVKKTGLLGQTGCIVRDVWLSLAGVETGEIHLRLMLKPCTNEFDWGVFDGRVANTHEKNIKNTKNIAFVPRTDMCGEHISNSPIYPTSMAERINSGAGELGHSNEGGEQREDDDECEDHDDYKSGTGGEEDCSTSQETKFKWIGTHELNCIHDKVMRKRGKIQGNGNTETHTTDSKCVTSLEPDEHSASALIFEARRRARRLRSVAIQRTSTKVYIRDTVGENEVHDYDHDHDEDFAHDEYVEEGSEDSSDEDDGDGSEKSSDDSDDIVAIRGLIASRYLRRLEERQFWRWHRLVVAHPSALDADVTPTTQMLDKISRNDDRMEEAIILNPPDAAIRALVLSGLPGASVGSRLSSQLLRYRVTLDQFLCRCKNWEEWDQCNYDAALYHTVQSIARKFALEGKDSPYPPYGEDLSFEANSKEVNMCHTIAKATSSGATEDEQMLRALILGFRAKVVGVRTSPNSHPRSRHRDDGSALFRIDVSLSHDEHGIPIEQRDNTIVHWKQEKPRRGENSAHDIEDGVSAGTCAVECNDADNESDNVQYQIAGVFASTSPYQWSVWRRQSDFITLSEQLRRLQLEQQTERKVGKRNATEESGEANGSKVNKESQDSNTKRYCKDALSRKLFANACECVELKISGGISSSKMPINYHLRDKCNMSDVDDAKVDSGPAFIFQNLLKNFVGKINDGKNESDNDMHLQQNSNDLRGINLLESRRNTLLAPFLERAQMWAATSMLQIDACRATFGAETDCMSNSSFRHIKGDIWCAKSINGMRMLYDFLDVRTAMRTLAMPYLHPSRGLSTSDIDKEFVFGDEKCTESVPMRPKDSGALLSGRLRNIRRYVWLLTSGGIKMKRNGLKRPVLPQAVLARNTFEGHQNKETGAGFSSERWDVKNQCNEKKQEGSKPNDPERCHEKSKIRHSIDYATLCAGIHQREDWVGARCGYQDGQVWDFCNGSYAPKAKDIADDGGAHDIAASKWACVGAFREVELDLQRTSDANAEGRPLSSSERTRLRRILYCFALAHAEDIGYSQPLCPIALLMLRVCGHDKPKAAAISLRALSSSQLSGNRSPSSFDIDLSTGSIDDCDNLVSKDCKSGKVGNCSLTDKTPGQNEKENCVEKTSMKEETIAEGDNGDVPVTEAEEDSFWLLSALAINVLPNYFSRRMLGSQVDLSVLRCLLDTYLPELSSRMVEGGLPLELVASPWLLSLFTRDFPSRVAERVLDWLFLDRSSNVLLYVLLAFFRSANDAILLAEWSDGSRDNVSEGQQDAKMRDNLGRGAMDSDGIALCLRIIKAHAANAFFDAESLIRLAHIEASRVEERAKEPFGSQSSIPFLASNMSQSPSSSSTDLSFKDIHDNLRHLVMGTVTGSPEAATTATRMTTASSNGIMNGIHKGSNDDKVFDRFSVNETDFYCGARALGKTYQKASSIGQPLSPTRWSTLGELRQAMHRRFIARQNARTVRKLRRQAVMFLAHLGACPLSEPRSLSSKESKKMKGADEGSIHDDDNKERDCTNHGAGDNIASNDNYQCLPVSKRRPVDQSRKEECATSFLWLIRSARRTLLANEETLSPHAYDGSVPNPISPTNISESRREEHSGLRPMEESHSSLKCEDDNTKCRSQELGHGSITNSSLIVNAHQQQQQGVQHGLHIFRKFRSDLSRGLRRAHMRFFNQLPPLCCDALPFRTLVISLWVREMEAKTSRRLIEKEKEFLENTWKTCSMSTSAPLNQHPYVREEKEELLHDDTSVPSIGPDNSGTMSATQPPQRRKTRSLEAWIAEEKAKAAKGDIASAKPNYAAVEETEISDRRQKADLIGNVNIDKRKLRVFLEAVDEAIALHFVPEALQEGRVGKVRSHCETSRNCNIEFDERAEGRGSCDEYTSAGSKSNDGKGDMKSKECNMQDSSSEDDGALAIVDTLQLLVSMVMASKHLPSRTKVVECFELLLAAEKQLSPSRIIDVSANVAECVASNFDTSEEHDGELSSIEDSATVGLGNVLKLVRSLTFLACPGLADESADDIVASLAIEYADSSNHQALSMNSKRSQKELGGKIYHKKSFNRGTRAEHAAKVSQLEKGTIEGLESQSSWMLRTSLSPISAADGQNKHMHTISNLSCIFEDWTENITGKLSQVTSDTHTNERSLINTHGYYDFVTNAKGASYRGDNYDDTTAYSYECDGDGGSFEAQNSIMHMSIVRETSNWQDATETYNNVDDDTNILEQEIGNRTEAYWAQMSPTTVGARLDKRARDTVLMPGPHRWRHGRGGVIGTAGTNIGIGLAKGVANSTAIASCRQLNRKCRINLATFEHLLFSQPLLSEFFSS